MTAKEKIKAVILVAGPQKGMLYIEICIIPCEKDKIDK